MKVPLPESFLEVPLTHRGLHGLDEGCVENGMSSFKAAISKGYGIELDVQMSKDGQAMVVHDYDLDRLTNETGPIADKTAEELGEITLKNSSDTISTLAEVLGFVDGRVPVLVEVKDQDGSFGPNVGRLEQGVATAIENYEGPIAVMSFNPHSVAAMRESLPNVPRGLTSYSFEDRWDELDPDAASSLVEIHDYDRLEASFISHDVSDLGRARVSELKSQGARILCWTVRGPIEEAAARKVAENITFEGYLAPLSP